MASHTDASFTNLDFSSTVTHAHPGDSRRPQGNLWWVVDPEFHIYRVIPGGETTLFAQNLPIDPAAVMADSQGDVYFTSPSGIYRIFREP